MHKSQVLFYFLLAFIGGIFTASFLLISQTWVLVFLILAISLIAIFGYQKTYSRKGFFAGLLFLVFVFGIIRFNSFNFSNSILNQFADVEIGGKGTRVSLVGYIDDEPTDRGVRREFILKVKQIIVGDRTVEVNDRVLITTQKFPEFKYGDILFATGSLEKPRNLTDFDYVAYLKKEGIKMTTFYPKVTVPTQQYDSMIYHTVGYFEGVKISLYRKIFELKNKFESAINKSISEPNASFINGILLGSRQDISEEMKDAFNKTGTTHILAISGYNIMIISWAILTGLVYFFKRRTAFWISVGIIILFTILTGASSSVVRASIMGLLLLFANGYGRIYDAKNSIILAGAAMIWINPFVLVFDVGFQLSFLAVIGLIYLYPFLNNKFYKIFPILSSTKSRQQNRGSSISQSNQISDLREIGTEFGKFKELTLMTISAQLAVAPLLIYYFHQFSPLSLPVNILILPFVPLAMLAGFVSGIVGIIFLPLGKIIGFIAWAITTYQIKIIEFFASI